MCPSIPARSRRSVPAKSSPYSATPIRRAEGQVLVRFALGLLAFLGFAALTIDYGYWLNEKRGLQNAADAAAQAGVSELLERPISSNKQVAAARHAMSYLDDQLGMGIKANGQLNCASDAALNGA